MPDLNFPDTPLPGTQYSAAGNTWTFDGIKWSGISSGGGGGSSSVAVDYSVLSWLSAGQPDGTTDNTAQMQTAINATSSKGVLYFPATAQPYIVGSGGGLQLPSNTHIVIQAGATLQIAPGVSANALGILPNASNILIELYGTLDGNGTASTPPVTPSGGIVALSSGPCSNVYVRGDRQGLIKNFVDWPVSITACTNGEVAGITMDGGGYSNSAEFTGKSPVNAATVTAGTYNNTTGAVVLTTSAAHGMSPGAAFVLLSTAGTGNYAALAASYTAGAGTSGTTINATTYAGYGAATLTGATIRGPTIPSINVGFSNCTIRNIADLGCVLYGGVYNGFIRDCDISNCTGGGAMVFSDNAQPGVNVGCEIVDNVLHGNGGYGAYVGHNLTAQNIRQRQITIAHNNVYANNGCGVYIINVDGVLVDNNTIHENIYQANIISSLGITGEISTHTNSGRVTISNNVIYNPNVGCTDGNGYGIAFNASNYLLIEGNRIGDYQATMSMQAALAGNWGVAGCANGNQYGPRIATAGAFPADVSVYTNNSQQGANYDTVLRLWSNTTGTYVPTAGDASATTVLATGSTAARTLASAFGDIYNFKALGGACDGVTDDTTALVNAFANLPTGSTIRFPRNTVTIIGDAKISTTKAISLIGEGPSSIIKLKSGVTLTTRLISWMGASDIRVTNLTIDLSSSPNPASLIDGVLYWQTGGDNHVREVRIINAPSNLYLICFHFVNGFAVEDCYLQVYNPVSSVQSKGIATEKALGQPSNGRITGNIMVGTNTNFAGANNMYIANNDISGWGVGSGICNGSSASPCANWVCVGNRVHDSLTGADMFSFYPKGFELWISRSIVANNQAWNCASWGIFQAGDGTGPSNSIIIGNQCWDNQTYSGSTTDVTNGGIAVGTGADGTCILDNRCWDSGVGRQNYGFNIVNTGIVNLTLSGNRFLGVLGDVSPRISLATYLSNTEYVPRTLTAGATVTGGALTATNGAAIAVDGTAGAARQLNYTTAGVMRWRVSANSTAEGTGPPGAGSDFDISGYQDSGAAGFNPLVRFVRATGQIQANRSIFISTGGGNALLSSGGAPIILNANASGAFPYVGTSAITQNVGGGFQEMDFINCVTTATQSFRWYQQTAALPAAAWTGNTAYAVNAQVINNIANIYICTVAGTSAASGGPTGTGSGIVDGSVTWNWVSNVIASEKQIMNVSPAGALSLGSGASTNNPTVTPGTAAANPVIYSQSGTGGLQINATIGFNSTAPVAKPTVAGACAGNTAIKALLTALAAYGLVTDSTTA